MTMITDEDVQTLVGEDFIDYLKTWQGDFQQNADKQFWTSKHIKGIEVSDG